jgi:hypothetical protein
MAICLALLTYTFSTVFGAALGIGISFIVNSTLVEIANNTFFAYVNGILTVLVLFNLLSRYRIIYSHEVIEK